MTLRFIRTPLALFLATGCAVAVLAAGCGGGGGARGVSSLGSTCETVVFPLPPASLISPATGATGVSTSPGTVTFQIDTNTGSGAVGATVSAVSLIPAPSGTSIPAAQVAAQGTPSPSGSTIFSATFSATLAPSTTYGVSISGVQPEMCGGPYTTSAGSFTTGS